MFCEYIQAAMSKAVYEVIDDEEPYYGEVSDQRAFGQRESFQKSVTRTCKRL